MDEIDEGMLLRCNVLVECAGEDGGVGEVEERRREDAREYDMYCMRCEVCV